MKRNAFRVQIQADPKLQMESRYMCRDGAEEKLHGNLNALPCYLHEKNADSDNGGVLGGASDTHLPNFLNNIN